MYEERGPGCCGIIMLGLAIFGAWTLYQRATEPSEPTPKAAVVRTATATTLARAIKTNTPDTVEIDCKALAEWGKGNKARADEQNTLLENIQRKERKGTATRKTYEAFLADIYAIADEQRNSHPPAGAEHLNELVADSYELLGDATEQYFNGDTERGDDTYSEVETLLDEMDQESERLNKECR
jgi:hypothetical protein